MVQISVVLFKVEILCWVPTVLHTGKVNAFTNGNPNRILLIFYFTWEWPPANSEISFLNNCLNLWETHRQLIIGFIFHNLFVRWFRGRPANSNSTRGNVEVDTWKTFVVGKVNALLLKQFLSNTRHCLP